MLADILSFSENTNKIAIIDAGQMPAIAVSYLELNQRVQQLSNYFIVNKFSNKSRIGIFLENSSTYVSLLLAMFRCGVVAVPISLKLTKSQINAIAEDCEIIICELSTSALLPKLSSLQFAEKILSEAKNLKIAHFERPSLNDEALILYTSGSTGAPKGVIHSQSGLGWKIENSAEEISSLDLDDHFTHYLANPLYHMNGLSSVLVMLRAQLTVVLTPKFKADEAARVIRENKISTIIAVPTKVAQIIAINPLADYKTVFWIKLGSAPVEEKLLIQIKTAFPRAKTQNNYGLTEIGPSLFGDHPSLLRPELSVGFPRPGIEYRIVNRILQIKSPSQFKGYSSTQVDSNKMTADGFYITNDLFRVDESGFYFFQGRADDMIVCGGENIYLSSIKDLLDLHPEIASSAAIGLDDEIKGKKPYAFVVLKSNITETQLIDYLRPFMTQNSLPRKIWSLENIPLTETGKVAQKTLESLAHGRLQNSNNI